MSQNTSHAVMAQRVEPHDSLDFFPTPPWATRALCEFIRPSALLTCWEPACGEGHMSRPLLEYFPYVYSSDVYDYGFGAVCDFPELSQLPIEAHGPKYNWIITNPPFKLAEEFALTGLKFAINGVALLVRSAFLESVGRHERLFSIRRPTWILQFTERVPMLKGRVSKEATTATAYCWLVWSQPPSEHPTAFHWIAPCRKRLEREGDYA